MPNPDGVAGAPLPPEAPAEPVIIDDTPADADAAVAVDPPAPAAAPEQFICAICDRSFPVTEIYDTGGSYTCRSCYAKRVAMQSGNGHPLPTVRPPEPIRTQISAGPAVTHAGLRTTLTCPHCWNRFAVEDVLWVSEHADLLGDVVLGPEAAARFLPSRFTVEGNALDGRGQRCHALACPRCHLLIPRSLLESDPLFISIVGVPACGKSYLLATMSWELRGLLPREFGISFSDADTLANRSLNEYEETLFLPSDPDRLVAIRKTELQGELYDQVRLGQQIVTLPRPFLFALQLTDDHPGAANHSAHGSAHGGGHGPGHRLICLYDNAGEHFLPGMDQSNAPVTRHLERSRVLMFLYDPTQDSRFRERCRRFSTDPQLDRQARTQRQETVLTETALRVRRLANLSPGQKHHRPLLVVLPKSDVWGPLVDADLTTEPLLRHVVASNAGPNRFSAVDVLRIEATSDALRTMLLKYAPEVVAAAEDFCTHVVYLPASALGRAPEVQAETGMLGVRPRDIRPRWVTVPVLYTLARWATGWVAGNHYGSGDAPHVT